MGQINPYWRDRVRFWLQHTLYGNELIDEPVGWDEDEKEYARNKDYHGIFAKFSNNLKFVENGASYINNVKTIYGINANIRLVKQYLDDDDVWQVAYTGFLDLATWEEEDNQVSVKFNSSGLEKTLKARRGDKVELERLDSLTGSTIPALDTVNLNLPGRRVFLKTEYDIRSTDDRADAMYNQTNGQTRGCTIGVPVHLISQSHDEAHSVIPNTVFGDNSHDRTANGIAANQFFAISQVDRSLRVKFDIDFNAWRVSNDINWHNFRLLLTTYQNGSNFNFKEHRVILFTGNLPHSLTNYSFSFDEQIDLLAGESLSLQFHQLMDGQNGHSAHLRCKVKDIVCPMVLEEDSISAPTVTKGILAHEMFDRLVTIMTGQSGNFRSELLGRPDIPDLNYSEIGKAAHTIMSHGHWIRRFGSNYDPNATPDVNSPDRLYKPFTTSFKEAATSFMATNNVGIGIRKVGFREQIILEDRKYFYNNNVLIRIGEYDSDGKFNYTPVQKVKRKVADLYYSSVEVGSEKGGDYEEIMGLEETNTRSNYISTIDAVTKEYKKLAKYRFDPYGEEIIRRRSIDTHSTYDHKADKDIWMHDVKPGQSGYWDLKQWQDVLAQEPVGMFSPETGYNFLYSPAMLVKEHGWILNAGLREYPNGVLSFGSSTGNSSVSMQKIGGVLQAENEGIPNNELGKERFVPIEIEFQHVVSQNLINQIEGSTTILGKEIPNLYGLVEFMNEKLELERGFLLSVKPNKEGKWKILKASR